MRLRRVEFIWVCRDISSFEWFQTLLSSLERQGGEKSTDFLRIHTYLTQKLDADTAQNIVLNSVGMEVDPLTQLRTGTQYGRPDFPKLFATMRDGIIDQSYIAGMEGTLRTNVGVYFCGPSVAARAIRKACDAASTPDVNFGFWKEQLVFLSCRKIKLIKSTNLPTQLLKILLSGLQIFIRLLPVQLFFLVIRSEFFLTIYCMKIPGVYYTLFIASPR